MVYNYRNKQRSIDGYRWSLMIMKWNLRQLPSVTTHLPDHSVASWALLWRLRAHCEVPVSWDTVAGVDRTNRIIGDSLKINLSIKRLITIISEIQWLHTISVRCLALRCLANTTDTSRMRSRCLANGGSSGMRCLANRGGSGMWSRCLANGVGCSGMGSRCQANGVGSSGMRSRCLARMRARWDVVMSCDLTPI
jgi:hypothetical protein